MKKLNATQIYLLMNGAMSLFMSIIFTYTSLYETTVVGLTPLQLVLVGTTVEISIFVFEIPTGIVADVYSRRLSILIGTFIVGLAFILEGAFPSFLPILAAQVVWGLGYTFTSGATNAWISDEIGEEAASPLFLRSAQVDTVAGLAGILVGIALAFLPVHWPIILGGVMILLLAIFLAWVMPEHGFIPTPRGERTTAQQMIHTFRQGLKMVERRPILVSILWIGLFYGLFSEGYDRLWTKLIVDNFTFPALGPFGTAAWLGGMRAVGLLFSIGVTEWVRRRVDLNRSQPMIVTLLILTAVLCASMFLFAQAPILPVAVVAFWLISITRNTIWPIYDAWVNQRLDSQVRATVLSMSGQVDAIGQVAGGPVVGWIGSALSVRAAITASSLLLTPILPIYARLLGKGEEAPPAETQASIPSID